MEILVLREERPSFNYLNDFGGFWKPGADRNTLHTNLRIGRRTRLDQILFIEIYFRIV